MIAFTPARAWGGFVLVFASFVAGCSSEKPSGKVAGKVTYKGHPVTAGDVTFRSKSGAAAIGRIDASGQYALDSSLEAGEYQVFATPPLPEPQAPGTKVAVPPKFELPSKFRDPSSSGVTVTVKGGANDIAVEFKD